VTVRIAIDYTSALMQQGGIGRHTRELVAALAVQDAENAYLLFAAGHRGGALPPLPGPNFSWRATTASELWLARIWHRARLPIPIERWTGPIDLLHAPDFVLPPARLGTRTVLTVHDLSFARSPETTPPRLVGYLNQVVPRSVHRADRVLAVSEATRQDVIALYGAPPEKVTVVYNGVDARFRPIEDADRQRAIRERYGIGEAPYILAVGAVHARKNYPRLIEAVHRLGRPELRLVIAGGRGHPRGPVHTRIAELGLAERVVFAGFVGDEDLPALYSAARVVAFPSIYEGFGLPALEGMACGTPVVTSNTSSLPEIVGDAGLLVDPYDVEALANALARALDDEGLRSSLVEKGLHRARRFTWAEAARQVRAVYAELV
jgi:glycosyltransferase involved in cell wall biosynthesis